MDKLISIKEARIKKGLSINDLSKALKLDLEIIRLLDDNLKLPKKYRAYQSTYKKSIYRYLGYEIKYKSSISDIPIDYTKLSIIYFLLFLVIFMGWVDGDPKTLWATFSSITGIYVFLSVGTPRLSSADGGFIVFVL